MPLLERDRLVDLLHDAQREASADRGRVVLVSGEPGAGKSALVRAALPASVVGWCEPLTTPRPLGPFQDIAAALWPDRPLSGDPISTADRLLRHLASPGPALIIEDAHWIDTASADVLRYLCRRLAGTSGLLVVVARDGAPAVASAVGDIATLDEFVRIGVPPLSADAVARLTAGTGIDPAEAERLTGGNAFLVSQLLMEPSGRPAASLRDATTARLSRLSPGARGLVERLAVIPGRIPAALIGADRVELDELHADGLLRTEEGAVEFRHELLRLAVEAGVPASRRRALHEDVLERLSTVPSVEPATIAHHARLAGRDDLATRAEVDAARRAAAFGSHHEAAEHLRRAVADARVGTDPATQTQLLLLLALQESAIARETDARDAAERAVVTSTLVDDPLLRSAAVRVRSRLEPTEEPALHLAGMAVDLSEPFGPSVQLAAAVANLANLRMIARDLDHAQQAARRAIELAQSVGDVESEIVAANALGSSLLLRSDPAGEGALRRAIHLGAIHGFTSEVGRAYSNLVSAACEARNYELSEAAANEAMRYFTARDLDAHANYTRAWTARRLVDQGRWADASAELAALLDPDIQTNLITRVITHYLTARLAARRGDASPYGALAAAEKLAGTTGALQRLAPVIAIRAEADRFAGRPTDVGRLRAVLDLAERRRDPWAAGELALWLQRAGAGGTTATVAQPYRLNLDGDLRGAARSWTALGCPYEAADALADGHDELDLRQALRIADELRALPLRRRIAGKLQSIGARSIPRAPQSGRHSPADGLSTREAEVLALLVTAASDAEIAAQLGLSVRTVEHHVAAILHKKQVSSRRALRSR